MAAPVYGKGYYTGLEIADESVYGTLGATEYRLLCDSESLNDNKPFNENSHMAAEGAARQIGFQDRVTAGGGIVVQADYDYCLYLIANAMGGGTPPNYAFPTDPADNTKSISVVVDRHLRRYQFTGGMIEELRIRGDSGDPRVYIEADFICQKCTPSATALQATTLPTARVLYKQLVFRIGDISDALAAGDALVLSSFLLRIKNNYKTEYGNGSEYIVQPIRGSQRQVSLEITAMRWSDEAEITAIQTAAEAGSQLQADLTFTGAGSDAWSIKLPELFLNKNPHQNISGKNDLAYTATFDCYANVHNTTHMSGVAYEMELDATT